MKWIQGIVISLSLLLGACGEESDPDGGDTSNLAPTAVITSPANGSVHSEDRNVLFVGRGMDDEDGALTGARLVWSSQIDGQLGTGTDIFSMLSAGSHTITLKATDSDGATGTDTIAITVNAVNTAPVIDNVTVSPVSVNVGMSVTVSWNITDAEGDTLICNLDIDADGSNEYTIDDCANNTSQIHTYTQAGDYQVRLTVVDDINAPVQQNVNVTITEPNITSPPKITRFSVTPEAPETGSSTVFGWDVSDGDGGTLTCKLDVDANGTDDYIINDCASNTSQTHTYTQAGVYQVRLMVEDGTSAPVQASIELTVSSVPLVISQFTVDPDPAYSTIATTFYWQISGPEGAALTCALDINNDGTDDYSIGDCANIASQEHTYTSSGDFTAQLTVRDSSREIKTTLPLVVKPHLLLDVAVNGPVSSEGRALYTMTVSNVSAQPVNDVSVVYTVPAELQFDAENDAEPNAEGCGTRCADGVEASWALGVLAEGESRTITINAQVLPGVLAGEQVIASVRASSSSVIDVVNVSRTVVVNNNPGSQLAVSASKEPLIPGDSLTFTVDVGNIDNTALDSLELRIILPAGVSANSISDSGTEDAVTGDIVWDVSSLSVGDTLRRTIEASVSATAIAGQILSIRAELRHDGGANLDASAEQVVTIVEKTFPLTLDISATPDPVAAGERLRYEFSISNVSAAPVNDISVLLRVPSGLQFDVANDAEPDATGCGAACIGSQEAFWVLGTLGSGENRTITVDALADIGLLGGSLITAPVRVTALDSGDDIDRVKTVAVTAEPVVGDLALARESGCLACHSIDTAFFGPSWRAIADRYKDTANAKALLVDKIKNGGRGNWGNATMPPYSPRVSDVNIEALADFILGL
ncbi:MAG: hypothetical protein L3J84_05055 [Gammaproteobacteria bacterium]|nr:hypothetical protein [Gammaproteobacteria bacterium]